MANILVTPEQLQQVSSQLNSGAATIQQTLSQLHAQVAPLQSEWRGQAQAQFERLWAEWNRSAAGIQDALHGISRLTAGAATSYSDTEGSVARSFAGS
jgi:WXG100 family type VII secretion target